MHYIREKGTITDSEYHWNRVKSHQYGAQDAWNEAYDEPLQPGAVAEGRGIQDLRREQWQDVTRQTGNNPKHRPRIPRSLFLLDGSTKLTSGKEESVS